MLEELNYNKINIYIVTDKRDKVVTTIEKNSKIHLLNDVYLSVQTEASISSKILLFAKI
jgi:hypothetical protein